MRYLYRALILLLTTATMGVMYVFQGAHFHQNNLSNAVTYPMFPNDITLIWVMTLPVAFCLWLGWVFFLQHVPWRNAKIPADVQGSLVIRYVTRGINKEAVSLSISTAYEVFKSAGLSDKLSIEVISDREIPLPSYASIILVPADFKTPENSLYKARALYYAQQQKPLSADEWVLYLDEESRLANSSVEGIITFMNQHHQKSKPPIGQGPIVYTGGSWFWRGADAIRLADDLGRFQLQYTLGVPVFGAHGSYLLLRGDVDKILPFDVGEPNSLTEDTAWALTAWQKGYRFGWVNGFILEQPPGTVKDFLKQRQRWLSGMKLVVKCPKIQWRYKIPIAIYTYLWQISFLSIMMTVLIFLWGLHPPLAVQLITDFSTAVYVVAYLIGNIVTSYITKRPLMVLTTILYPVYGLLESTASLLALRKLKHFYVVKKPRAEKTLSPMPDSNH